MATQYVTCPTCSSQNTSKNARCTNCGTLLPPISPMPMQHMPWPGGTVPVGADKKIAAGICGILLGSFGVHKFILGYQQEGLIMLVTWVAGLFFCGIPSIVIQVIGIIEGIIYLTKSDEDFSNTYFLNKKLWF